LKDYVKHYYLLVAAVSFPLLLAAVVYLVVLDFEHLGEAKRPPPAPAAAPAASSVFDDIYARSVWGINAEDAGTSGSGSTLEATAVYRAYLQGFLKENGIRSVVDAGCGDWEFSQAIDWSGIDYKGYDVVERVIAKDQAKYTKPNVHFFVADITTADLPEADLLLSKHVIQHLPNADVARFLKQLPKYKHVLLTNGVDPRTMSGENRDIPMGGYRPLDPTKPPFDLPGRKTLMWWDGHHMHQVVHLARKK
jgi:SAM-dependent methyltransferase